MKCQIVNYMIPVDNGPEARGVSRCDTHHWVFDYPCPGPCPIGRIEEATEEAIARIKNVAVHEVKGYTTTQTEC